jgi:uroporphyrinogen-III synthase
MAQDPQFMTDTQKTILLTRPLEDALRITPDFEELGFHVLLNPIIEIVSLDPHTLPVPLKNIEALCVTSRNALPALTRAPLKELSRDIPCYCVGKRTATDLEDLGFNFIDCAPSARDLLHLLQQTLTKNQTTLYLAGTVASVDFSQELPQCHKIICYDAKPTRTLLPEVQKAFQYTMITHIPLYSARSAALLNKLLTHFKVNLKGVTLCVLSAALANTLQGWDVKEIRIAKEPTHKGLLDLIQGD